MTEAHRLKKRTREKRGNQSAVATNVQPTKSAKVATAPAARVVSSAKTTTTTVAKATTTAPCATAPAKCCPQPSISYRNGIGSACAYGCKPPVQTVLTVKDPCTCCPVQVPVCIPACCTDEPTVGCRGTILGRGVVLYDWCCGFRVAVCG